MYDFNKEYNILKAYDAPSFILGLKEICNINIDIDKSYIGSMFSYRLFVDEDYIDIYDRVGFLDWIASKVEIEREGIYSYVTSLDYQIKLKQKETNKVGVKSETKDKVDIAPPKTEEKKPSTKTTTRKSVK